MRGRVRVLGRVAIRRAVTTQGRAALLTRSQMDPPPANFRALLALVALGLFNRRDRLDVSTGVVRHPILSLMLQRLMAMAIDPSPTAAATRLTLLPRTSPTANTLFAVCARKTAACPAELPPPTTMTSAPRQSGASVMVAA